MPVEFLVILFIGGFVWRDTILSGLYGFTHEVGTVSSPLYMGGSAGAERL